ncbi:hypothetical protein [Arthrobacter sp. SPG23]|uniref:hypothetical protein n=1 Tax=Arthrobacter sp. SPG23 TaxID=1610703 RepID=UPI0009E57F4A|nr:hypothetical protein [Arthrobacter sp. SPG23]
MKHRGIWSTAAMLALCFAMAVPPAASAIVDPPSPTLTAEPTTVAPSATSTPSSTQPTGDPTLSPPNAAPETISSPSATATNTEAPGSASRTTVPEATVSTPGQDAIEAEWQRLGGAAGALGNAVSATECGLSQDGCRRQFQNGKIHWTAGTGAFATAGDIGAVWAAHQEEAGRIGYPVGSVACQPSPSICQQSFQRGFIVSTGGVGTFAVYSPYSAAWTAYGAAAGRLGVPVAAEKCDAGGAGCSQRFQRGSIVWAAGSGTVALYDPYYSVWAANGMGAGRLGYPVSNERCTASGSGCVQQFQRGYVAWVPGIGTTLVTGIYSSVWTNNGSESGRLGLPIASEACGLVNSGCFQRFSGGSIYWNAGNGAYAVYGGYAQIWSQYGKEAGRLGYPVSGEQCGLTGPGCVQSFQGGYVYWAAGIGFHSVYGVYGQLWGAKRAQNGALGYPVSEESCQVSTCVQRFEGGAIQWTAGQGTALRYSEWGYCRALNVGAAKYSGGGAARVSFAISQGYGTTPVTFTNCVKRDGKYVHDWTVGGYAGESGFARPGVATGPTTGKYSPTGSYSITLAFGLSNPGTSLPYQTLNPYSRWGGRLNTNYNKYFESSADVFPDENMWYYATRPSGDYRQGAVINYNRPPDSNIVMDAGFAIFLHANPVPTWGCISLSEANVVRYLQSANYGDRLIMGVSNDVFE